MRIWERPGARSALATMLFFFMVGLSSWLVLSFTGVATRISSDVIDGFALIRVWRPVLVVASLVIVAVCVYAGISTTQLMASGGKGAVVDRVALCVVVCAALLAAMGAFVYAGDHYTSYETASTTSVAGQADGGVL